MGNMILAASKSSSSSFTPLLIIVVLIALFYFVMIRPQRNRQRKVQQEQNAVVPGQRVRTTAGMYATVVDVEGDDVILEVAPGVEVRYVKRAIMQVLPDGSEQGGMAGEPGYAADAEPGYVADAEAEHETVVDEDGTVAGAGDEAPVHPTDESPNGSPAADEKRASGSV
jgi:preprotein translocase YajC subunit